MSVILEWLRYDGLRTYDFILALEEGSFGNGRN